MRGRPVRRFRFLKPYAIQNAQGARGNARAWQIGDTVTDRQLTPTDLAQMLRPPAMKRGDEQVVEEITLLEN